MVTLDAHRVELALVVVVVAHGGVCCVGRRGRGLGAHVLSGEGSCGGGRTGRYVPGRGGVRPRLSTVQQSQLVVHISILTGVGRVGRAAAAATATICAARTASATTATTTATATRRRRGRGAVELLGGQIAQHAIDRRHTRYVVLRADVLVEEAIADLPGEYRRTLALVAGDAVHHIVGGHSRLAAANRTRLYATRLVVSAEDLAHAAIGHLKHAADVAWPRALVS